TVRGNLCTHHACAEHSDFFYNEITHETELLIVVIVTRRWIPASAGMTAQKSAAAVQSFYNS
ncbi:MAG: hypothetical protein ACKO71_00570, partial [Betaproteobacteria bacterium]